MIDDKIILEDLLSELEELRLENRALKTNSNRNHNLDEQFRLFNNDFASAEQQVDTLLNLLPVGVSICFDPASQEIRHNLQTEYGLT